MGKDKSSEVTFILGAGFSRCAGLPVQSKFSELLTSDQFDSEIDEVITDAIKQFLNDVFGWENDEPIPALEDIFTFIDLSVGSGHHLGIKYKPNRLRALRRMLIYKTFQIIDHEFNYSPDISSLLSHYADYTCSFVVVNWDIVLEKHLLVIDENLKVNYLTKSYDWNRPNEHNSNSGYKICKMHGSSNWVYCDNCKSLFYLIDEKLSLHKKVGLVKADFRLFNEKFTDTHFDNSLGIQPTEKKCKKCNNDVSSHIATFSYKKSFRTTAYPAIWSEAERLLAESRKWVFIGYSLPEADYELKHLIKSAELRLIHKYRNTPREIDVVIYKDDVAKTRYQKFFGKNNLKIYSEGLSEYVSEL